jgi:hypothetical protein
MLKSLPPDPARHQDSAITPLRAGGSPAKRVSAKQAGGAGGGFLLLFLHVF